MRGGLVVTPGHGTRTLGALCGNLPGIYIGVCPRVPVVPYRVTNGVMLTGQTHHQSPPTPSWMRSTATWPT